MHKLSRTKNSALCTIFFLLCFFVTMAQPQPDWSKFSNVKARVDTMTKYAISLIRKQKLDAGITVLANGLIIARQASFDSSTGAFLFLLGSAYRYKSQNDSALYYLGKAKKVAVQGKFIPLLAGIEGESYGIYNRAGKTDSATAIINRLKEILPLLDSNGRESAKIEMYLGHNDKHQAKYTEALAHYYKALRTFTYLKDSVNIGIMYVSLANVLVILSQPDKALDYHRQAAALFTLLNRRTELINELLNITDMYYTSDRLDSAEASIKKVLPIAQQANDKNALAYVELNLGNIYKRRKKYPEAEAHLLKAASMAEALGSENLLMESSQGLGEMYMSEKQPAKAEPYLEKHLSLAKQDNNLEEMIEASWNISENEYALHDYAKAYEYKNLYSNYRDSSFRQTSAKSIAEMEAKYQAEKKENEIIVLKKDQQLDRLSLQKQKNFQIGAIIFLLLLLLIGFLLINRYRVVHQAKRLIDMERMRNSLARDLHDDIGSTLTSINILSKVALQQQPGSDALMVSNMRKIKDRSAAIMESVSDIVWAINPQNDTTEQMIFRMKEFTAEILEPLNINYSFKEEGDLASLKLNIKKRKDLYLLFKEAINNAAKYSHCNNLTIQLKREGDSLHLSVKDDGAGFNVQEIKNGNGLRNMRDRAAAMGAKINIDTALGKGTGIVVDAPIT